jgi:hypothetical protein
MPYINRALADLGVPPDKIPLVGGVTWAQNSNDMSQAIYHFNSGNPLHKALRVRKFLSTLSARSS